jgi:hypothetical protein
LRSVRLRVAPGRRVILRDLHGTNLEDWRHPDDTFSNHAPGEGVLTGQRWCDDLEREGDGLAWSDITRQLHAAKPPGEIVIRFP